MHTGRVEIASEARSLAFALAGLRTCSRSAGCYEESLVSIATQWLQEVRWKVSASA